MAVPVLIVPGYVDDMIVGSNAIKHVMQHLKTKKKVVLVQLFSICHR